MADIKKELNDIKNAVYGKEVRGSIHDGIKKINDEVENATDLSESAKHQVENIQQQVNQLVVEGDSSVEAAQARVDAEGKSFPTLKARLDEKETQFSSQLAETGEKIDRVSKSYINRKPAFVWVDDDARIGVKTKLKNAFESRGMKGTIAVITDFASGSSDRYMRWSDIDELHQAGWEIISHSKSHPRLSEISDSEIREELSVSKQEMINRGYNDKVFVYPYGDYNSNVVDIVSEYYDYALDINKGRNSYPLSTYTIKRLGIGSYGERDFDKIKNLIDGAIENNELMVFMSHIDATENELPIIEQTLDYLISKGQTIMSFENAIKEHGNIIDTGKYRKGYDSVGFSISTDGIIGGYNAFNTIVTSEDEFTAENKPSDFETRKTTYTPIRDKRDGLPENRVGILITDRIGTSNNVLNIYQEFRISGTNRRYARVAVNDSSWTEWTPTSVFEKEIVGDDRSDFNKSPAEYPAGLNIGFFTNDKADNSPTNTGGLLFTIKPTTDNTAYVRQVFYPYNSTKTYKRHGKIDGMWSNWKNEDGVHIERLSLNASPSEYETGITLSIYTDSQVPDTGKIQRGGLLKTYKPANAAGYCEQEYTVYGSNPPIKLIRVGNGTTDSWHDWTEI